MGPDPGCKMLKPAGGGGAGGGGGGICECGSNSPPLDEDADEDEDEADDPLPVAAVAEDDEEAAEDPWPPTAEAEEDAAADEPPRGLELVLMVLGAAAENDKAATSRSHARCMCAVQFRRPTEGDWIIWIGESAKRFSEIFRIYQRDFVGISHDASARWKLFAVRVLSGWAKSSSGALQPAATSRKIVVEHQVEAVALDKDRVVVETAMSLDVAV